MGGIARRHRAGHGQRGRPATRGTNMRTLDITEMFVKKYGEPPVGSRIFIRTRQLISGWEEDFKNTNAVVPRG
jgi:hypothetical protein